MQITVSIRLSSASTNSTMTNKPLQYESLKIVLQYLDVNTRFQLANRCPSLRKTENLIPLFINELYFSSSATPFSVTVNSLTYAVGTIRVYPPDAQIPKCHEEQNEKGGVRIDLDQFGFEDLDSNEHVTPGDIVIGVPERVVNYRDENFLKENEKFIKILEKIITIQQNGETMLIPEYYGLHEDPLDSSFPPSFHIDYLQDTIKRRRTFLLPFYHRRDNTPKRFSTVVQLTVRSRDGVKAIQQFPGEKVYQVAKHLTKALFGGRNTINVKCFQATCHNTVIRLPAGLSIMTKHVVADPYLCTMLSPLFHPSSFPLDHISLDTFRNNAPYPEMMKSARKLTIYSVPEIHSFLRDVTNQILVAYNSKFSWEDYLTLARHWVETRRPVGTCYTFQSIIKTIVLETMECIKRELNGKKVDGYLIVPINESSELKVSYEDADRVFNFKFEVIAI